MTTRALLMAGVFLTSLLLSSPARAAVMLGQIETFDAPHNWVIGVGPGGGVPQPVPVQLGGPGGAADPYLSIESIGGAGIRSRLSAQNFVEWSGDYLAAGVDRILMDVNNFGPEDLFLRLLLIEFGMMGPVNAAFSTVPVFVPAGSGWQSVAFDVAPGDLTALIGTATAALSNAQEFRIFHNPLPFFAPGQIPPVVATLGVDNITAAAVPEPAALLLLSIGLLAVARLRPRRRSPTP